MTSEPGRQTAAVANGRDVDGAFARVTVAGLRPSGDTDGVPRDPLDQKSSRKVAVK